jgi:hypothetical protein
MPCGSAFGPEPTNLEACCFWLPPWQGERAVYRCPGRCSTPTPSAPRRPGARLPLDRARPSRWFGPRQSAAGAEPARPRARRRGPQGGPGRAARARQRRPAHPGGRTAQAKKSAWPSCRRNSTTANPSAGATSATTRSYLDRVAEMKAAIARKEATSPRSSASWPSWAVIGGPAGAPASTPSLEASTWPRWWPWCGPTGVAFANAAFENVLGMSRRTLQRGQVFDWRGRPGHCARDADAVARNEYATGRFEAQLKRRPAPRPTLLPVHVIVTRPTAGRCWWS